jgi:UDP-GlcNAc:undecaprenyl-phosphate GlcNAc-1-phosphate transferase
LISQSPADSCPVQSRLPELAQHMQGLRATASDVLVLLAGLLVLHVLGVLDDRRPLGPWLKLMVLVGVTGAVVWWTDTRLLTLLDAPLGGPWASIVVTVLWIVVVTNAMNFLDNMDGLSAGVGAIAGACFLAAALVHGQWFVAAMLAVLVGACGGFLVFNFPWRARRNDADGGGATIFMGDGGSLVIGFLLGFLTVRTTYYAPDAAGGWYGVFMPLVVLAIPLYDFMSVVLIRLSQGKSPLVGDLQHLSHRLVRRGLSKRAAVLVIHGLTGITAIGGIALGSLQPWQAVLVGVQTALVLLVLAVFEHRAAAPTLQRNLDPAGGPP